MLLNVHSDAGTLTLNLLFAVFALIASPQHIFVITFSHVDIIQYTFLIISISPMLVRHVVKVQL